MQKNGLYIQMFSIHGLIRSESLELGSDADTGGQIKYVLELCDTLSKDKNVRQVDLFTRLISDKKVSEDYSNPVETVNDKFRIVRIQCGGKKYLRKELLWPYLDEFVDKTIKLIKRENNIPDIVHGHYPDGGYIAKELSRFFDIPFIFTGHSLGRIKKNKLMNDGMGESEIQKQYKIENRIQTEESILENADLIITSTNQEIKEQYGIYRNGNIPRYRVIPPGIGLDKFFPYYENRVTESEFREELKFAKSSILRELDHFFQFPEKPIILALCRPDKRKNIEGLIKAYGEDLDLQAIANLAVFAGIRKDIAQKEDNEREVLTQMLLLMDKYNLYGKMAIPKKHDFEYEVPELYRIAAEKSGVFVNPAMTEPFGITLLEASATGLPIVATNDGGPNDIIKNCRSGILIDPSDTKSISDAVKKIIVHEDLWNQYSKNGIINTRTYYSWTAHAGIYLNEIKKLYSQEKKPETAVSKNKIGKRLAMLEHLLISDIDNTLIGGENTSLSRLMKLIQDNINFSGFGVATGRSISSTRKIMDEFGIIPPDIIISSVGTEIYYGKNNHYDRGWEAYILKDWKKDHIIELLKSFDFLDMQDNESQTSLKISYNMKPVKDNLAKIHNLLSKHRIRYNLVYSHEKYLDILPYRASKGKAIKYLSYKWEIPLQNFIVCGDSGNDEGMLKTGASGIVVGNYSRELERLKSSKKVYFAESFYSAGIIEGLSHFNFYTDFNKGK